MSSKKRGTVVYELYDNGKKVYIGITDDPERRRQEHKKDKKFDTMKIVTGSRRKNLQGKKSREELISINKGQVKNLNIIDRAEGLFFI